MPYSHPDESLLFYQLPAVPTAPVRYGLGNHNFYVEEEITVKTEPIVRIRIRGAIIRIQIAEPRIRTIIRIRRQEGA